MAINRKINITPPKESPLSPETIYKLLQEGNFNAITTFLYENGNQLTTDPTFERAVDIAIGELFRQVKIADKTVIKELEQDLDILFICHTEKKFRLKDEQAIALINLLHPRVKQSIIYKGAKDYPNEPLCKEIIEKNEQAAEQHRREMAKPYTPPVFPQRQPFEGKGLKYETEIRSKDGNSWVKVFLRSNELLDTVATHIRKLRSAGTVNITEKTNGNNDLTIYSRKPFGIRETHDEVNLTLENYFSRNASDPIFKDEVISGISEIAYFQVIDYMLKLGAGLETFRQLSEKMDEERYRDYFVAYLDTLSNAHTATGETFHGSGKSDILFRNQQKEVLLVAECKLWTGKEAVTKAIDQLFNRYISWRDGKAALMIFNTKNKNFTKIMETAVETFKIHPLFVSFQGQRKETSYSFTFRNLNDQNKYIKLELVMFNFL